MADGGTRLILKDRLVSFLSVTVLTSLWGVVPHHFLFLFCVSSVRSVGPSRVSEPKQRLNFERKQARQSVFSSSSSQHRTSGFLVMRRESCVRSSSVFPMSHPQRTHTHTFRLIRGELSLRLFFLRNAPALIKNSSILSCRIRMWGLDTQRSTVLNQ